MRRTPKPQRKCTQKLAFNSITAIRDYYVLSHQDNNQKCQYTRGRLSTGSKWNQPKWTANWYVRVPNWLKWAASQNEMQSNRNDDEGVRATATSWTFCGLINIFYTQQRTHTKVSQNSTRVPEWKWKQMTTEIPTTAAAKKQHPNQQLQRNECELKFAVYVVRPGQWVNPAGAKENAWWPQSISACSTCDAAERDAC